MINTERQLLEQADGMMRPVVYADVSKGSGNARFFLMDADDESVSKGFHELPRSTFNGCRDCGTLYRDGENPLMVGDHQAWNVRTESEDDGSEEEGGEV
jgi:hypothetical protein